MLDIDMMDVDLSIVKKEKLELEDYEKDSVNLLDNFISEHDYNDFPPTSMPCGVTEDGNVDWLTGFFDEPLNDNMSGLNPPLSDISHNESTSVSQITSINCNSDILLDSYSTFSEDYINNTMDTNSLKLSPAMFTKPSSNIRNKNPFLSQTNKDNELHSVVKLEDDDDNEITVKIEDDCSLNHTQQHQNTMQVDKPFNSSQQTLLKTTTGTTTNNSINNSEISLHQKQSTITLENKPQNQQKLLLFMNTPENRARLAGTNFNIINANLLSKFSGQQQQNGNICNSNNNNINNTNMNLINLKKCVNLNNTVRNEHCYQDTRLNGELNGNSTTTTTTVNTTLQSIMAQQQKEKKITPVDILGNSNNSYGFTRKDRSDSQEIDSGYESPTSSSGSSPRSPPIELERKECETTQYIDIPPHERQPFYLSEEEKRTLVMEGLPVPSGLPLNKTEERALKKVRRKIKNKISAQESRRKKKEYMESLEKKVDVYASENNILKKKVGSLEVANRSLIIQVQKLQALVASKISTPSASQDINEVTEVLEESA